MKVMAAVMRLENRLKAQGFDGGDMKSYLYDAGFDKILEQE